jgi:aryl-alcohol dehydrogenase-like predicted oxidoreductase
MGFGGTGRASAVGTIDVEGARRQIGLARDAGVNLIDTADVYSDGLAEEIVGKALGSDRDEMLLATKVRLPMVEVRALAVVAALFAALARRGV